MQLIDTHAHVNFNAYKDDAAEVLKKSLAEEVFVVNVGSQYSTSQRAVEMAQKYKGVFAAVGLHPVQLQKGTIEYADYFELTPEETKTTGEEFDYQKYLELAKNEKTVAIGEMGLDYYHLDPPRVDERFPRVEAGEGYNIKELIKKQKEILLQGIKLANEVQKPMAVHCREAYADLLEILQNNPVEKKGVIHCFLGNLKTAQEFIQLGFKIGLNGVITYSESYDKLIKSIELKDILLETDCPYLTPVPHKGERNEPVMVKLVAQKIAEIKGIRTEKVAEITTENAKRLFGI